MQEIIGLGSLNLLETGEIKKASLMFDKIAFPLIELELELQAKVYSSMAAISKENTLQGNLFALKMMEDTLFQINTVEYLTGKKVIFTSNLSDFDEIANKKSKGIVKKYVSQSNSHLDETLNLMRSVNKTFKKKYKSVNKEKILKGIFAAFDHLQIGIENYLRASSFMYQELTNCTCVPIISSRDSFEKNNEVSKVDVMQLTLHSLPVPDESVAWEEIFNFRNDPDSKSKFLALRNWMNEIAKGQLLLTEIEEKLEYLLDQYENHMKFHKMKYHKGVLETLITTTAEVAENLVRLKFSKLAQLPFTIKNKKLALMEEEIKAPGREVAYIFKARKEFL
jgi:hypothetical protein